MYELQDVAMLADEMFCWKRHLQLSTITWVWAGPTQWKERTDSWKLFSDLHTCVPRYMYVTCLCFLPLPPANQFVDDTGIQSLCGLLSTGHKLGSLRRRELKLRKGSHLSSLWANLWYVFLIDMGGPGPLWMVLPLGGLFKKINQGIHGEQGSEQCSSRASASIPPSMFLP